MHSSWGLAVTVSAGRHAGTCVKGSILHAENLDRAGVHWSSFFLSNRNPDIDEAPWCYTYKNMLLTWELCDIPKCCKLPHVAMSKLGI